MTTKNAQYRPHCVDFTPNKFHSAANTSSLGAARRQAKASERFSRQQTRATRLSSRPVVAGAVRNTAPYSRKPRYAHTGKVAFALSLIAGGIFWTNGESIGNTAQPESAAALPTAKARLAASDASSATGATITAAIAAAATLAPPPASAPAFFFDDAIDALTAHFSSTAKQMETAAASNKRTSTTRVVSTSMQHLDSVSATQLVSGQTAAHDSTTVTASIKPGLPGPDTVALLPLTNLPSLEAVRANAISPEGATTTVVAVARGNTLSGILNERGVKIEQMPQLLTDTIVKTHLSNLTIGQELKIAQLPNGEFHSLTTRVGNDKRITIRRSANDFAVASIDLPVEKERVVTSGTIEQSLYLAAEQANLKQSTIMELADIFQWELDFARDIRKGDQFSLVYDRLYRDGSYIGDGDILAAEFVRGGRTHRAIRFTTDDGETGYYSPDGTSKRRTFKRHPVDLVRITSKFNPNRMHPVLHQIRAHRGVDYGAPHGSPIYATADGKIKFSGKNGAYGKTVILQHGQKFSTLYAHMSKISSKSKVGKRVKQGDVIGYVGKTGRVTGTHLHYEFRVNNKQIDPLKIKLPAAEPIARKYLPELKRISDEMTEQMSSVLADIDGQVASLTGHTAMTALASNGTATKN